MDKHRATLPHTITKDKRCSLCALTHCIVSAMSDWKNLVFVLFDLLQGPLVSIEILPGSLEEWEGVEIPPGAEKPCLQFPFVLVQGNLGIPKKVLYAIYMAALDMPWRSSDVRTANPALSVIILVNPAHQTALNYRKRLIREAHLDAAKELSFTELIARGYPEFGKQSMIWDHRRWCFAQIYGTMGTAVRVPYLQHWAKPEEIQIFPKMGPNAIQHELDLIHRTCETYPRNYHGWSHWHLTINICYASIYISEAEDSATKRGFFGIIVEAYTRLQKWVNHHVSDYSAIHHLHLTYTLIKHLSQDQSFVADLTKDLTSEALADHALSLLTDFPTHESLWMYLRISIANLAPENRTKILEQVVLRGIGVSDECDSYRLMFFAWFSEPRLEPLSTEVQIPYVYHAWVPPRSPNE